MQGAIFCLVAVIAGLFAPLVSLVVYFLVPLLYILPIGIDQHLGKLSLDDGERTGGDPD